MKEIRKSTIVISSDIKKLLILIVSLIIIVFCFVLTFKVGLNKLRSQQIEIKKIGTNINVLNQKQVTLSKLRESISDQIAFFSAAIPSVNPTLSIIYQIKYAALERGLFFDNIKSGGESQTKKYSKVDLNFDIEGSLNEIISFLKLSETFSPIITIDKLELSGVGSAYKASIIVKGYWSSLPEKIPAINQPLSDFTEEEIDLITKISRLSVPATYEVSPSEEFGKENPFN